MWLKIEILVREMLDPRLEKSLLQQAECRNIKLFFRVEKLCTFLLWPVIVLCSSVRKLISSIKGRSWPKKDKFGICIFNNMFPLSDHFLALVFWTFLLMLMMFTLFWNCSLCWWKCYIYLTYKAWSSCIVYDLF